MLNLNRRDLGEDILTWVFYKNSFLRKNVEYPWMEYLTIRRIFIFFDISYSISIFLFRDRRKTRSSFQAHNFITWITLVVQHEIVWNDLENCFNSTFSQFSLFYHYNILSRHRNTINNWIQHKDKIDALNNKEKSYIWWIVT